MRDDLGDRLKTYEAQETDRYLNDSLPVIVRIDGRAFSTFTRSFEKPFDRVLTSAMQNVTQKLITHTGAVVGYTQSDEITLILERGDKENSQIFFNGKIQKLTSIIASLTTAYFMLEFKDFPEILEKCPHFDTRVFNVPSLDEAVNVLLWRFKDCHRNAVSSVCQKNFSQKQLNGINKNDQIVLLAGIGIDFDMDFHSDFKFGSLYTNKKMPRQSDDGIISMRKTISKVILPALPNFKQLKEIYYDLLSE